MRILNLILIYIFILLSRIFYIDKVPILGTDTQTIDRVYSVFANITIGLLIFLIIKKKFRNYKLALLSQYIFYIFPWSIEQGRIVSVFNYLTLFILLSYYLILKIRLNIYKYIIVLISLFILQKFYFFYIFQDGIIESSSLEIYLNNFYNLISFKSLFFNNEFFWWGGLKDVGIMYIFLLPFFLHGLILLIRYKLFSYIYFLIIVVIIASFNKNFPETRELYLTLPVFAFITAASIYTIWGKYKLLLSLILSIFLVFESSLYWHNYFYHYPSQIINNILKLNEKF
jgi:hypothetical protein